MTDIRIDLFSDTNVNPSPGMRNAMANAVVGNEVAGEDPTVNQLLEKICVLLNKPAAVFMPSGSMCNSTGLRALCQPGDRIVLEKQSHALNMTAGMIGGLIGAQPEVILGQRGKFTVEQVKQAIGNNDGYNIAKARVICIEQTTNFGGGAIWTLDELKAMGVYAHNHNISLHMDGARLLNACVATGYAAAKFTESFDSVWIDFAKGLGAPLGAVIAGNQEFIERVWHYKFQQGGGMHQAGILAAACLYGLENNIERLAIDHQHAKLFAELLSEIPEIEVEPDLVETNIVIFSTPYAASDLTDRLRMHGIRLLGFNQKYLRAITHMGITREQIHEVAKTIGTELKALSDNCTEVWA